MTKEKPSNETEEERAERRFNDQAKLLHGDRLVMHYFEGVRRAILAHSKNTGKWLGIVALACSTPNDNSEEVKAKAAEITAKLDASEHALQSAIDNVPKQS